MDFRFPTKSHEHSLGGRHCIVKTVDPRGSIMVAYEKLDYPALETVPDVIRFTGDGCFVADCELVADVWIVVSDDGIDECQGGFGVDQFGR